MIQEKDIICEIQFYKKYLNKIESEINLLKKQVPNEAALRATRHGRGYQYFLRIKGNRTNNGTYIKKDNIEFARKLAQIEYDLYLQNTLKELVDMLENIKTLIENNPFQNAADKMTISKRVLVTVPYISDDSYVFAWVNQEYEGLQFKEDYPEYFTRRGLRVRSKSEVIIADILDEFNIPFLYEKPLKLGDDIVHPDFTLLNIKERKEIYWEHFGIMDDIEYRNNALLKIRKYELEGIFQYDSIIYSFESGRNPLNTKSVRKMISMLREKLGY